MLLSFYVLAQEASHLLNDIPRAHRCIDSVKSGNIPVNYWIHGELTYLKRYKLILAFSAFFHCNSPFQFASTISWEVSSFLHLKNSKCLSCRLYIMTGEYQILKFVRKLYGSMWTYATNHEDGYFLHPTDEAFYRLGCGWNHYGFRVHDWWRVGDRM